MEKPKGKKLNRDIFLGKYPFITVILNSSIISNRVQMNTPTQNKISMHIMHRRPDNNIGVQEYCIGPSLCCSRRMKLDLFYMTEIT